MADSAEALFAYGSLQSRDIFESVMGVSRLGVPATLPGYRCVQLRGFCYPAVIPSDGAYTRGLVYSDLSPALWPRLDAYEDHFYERKCMRVLLDGGEASTAFVYVLAASSMDLALDTPWSLDDLDANAVRSLIL